MPEGLKAVDAALDRVASRMTPVIQNRAVEAGWPEDVASRLSMVRSPTGIGVHFSGDSTEAEDLEFGSATSGPRSVLTSFHTPAMKQQIEKISRDSMDEIIERIGKVFS
jgi:hypothetical protein